MEFEKIVRMLIDKGADPNAVLVEDHSSPLIVAAVVGNTIFFHTVLIQFEMLFVAVSFTKIEKSTKHCKCYPDLLRNSSLLSLL